MTLGMIDDETNTREDANQYGVLDMTIYIVPGII